MMCRFVLKAHLLSPLVLVLFNMLVSSAARRKKAVQTIEVEHNVAVRRGEPYEYLQAASAPISTICSWWDSGGENEFYAEYGHLCGVVNNGKAAIEAHFEKIWSLIQQAASEFQRIGEPTKTLKVFVAPEWAFRKYPPKGQQYSPPLSFEDMQYILSLFLNKLSAEKMDDWLIVPGSILWGIQSDRLSELLVDKSSRQEYIVFNTLPVFYKSKLVHVHNKFTQSDNLNDTHELWGYEIMNNFDHAPNCSKIGHGGSNVGSLCGSAAFADWLRQTEGEAAFHQLSEWGLTQHAPAVLVNGLVVGVDICVDHRVALGKNIRAMERVATSSMGRFDIQILVSSGMTFFLPEGDGAASLFLRRGGVAISADGANGPDGGSRLLVSELHDTRVSFKAKGVRVQRKGGILNAVMPGRERRLKLYKDFKQKAPTVRHSWMNACQIDSLCNACASGDLSRDWPGIKGVSTLCNSQAGNYRLLKVWSEPVELPSPQELARNRGY